MAGNIRVVVDWQKCSGLGACEAEAPGVVEVQDDGNLKLLKECPTADELEAVQGAVEACHDGVDLTGKELIKLEGDARAHHLHRTGHVRHRLVADAGYAGALALTTPMRGVTPPFAGEISRVVAGGGVGEGLWCCTQRISQQHSA